jgi:ADP-ribosylglycohydrolase
MIGTILGDVIGSRFEHNNVKRSDFSPLFDLRKSKCTDDSVLTVAVADAILNQTKDGIPYKKSLLHFAKKFPNAGYGGRFKEWFKDSSHRPYHSYGNGSAMRVSAVGFAFDTLEDVLREAKNSALPKHNHSEGIKGAQAVATAILMARQGQTKAKIKAKIIELFAYDLDQSLDQIRPTYKFDVTCQGSVPQAIIAFLEGQDVEDTIRKAISIGGDSDTIAAMAGGIAEAFYQRDEKAMAQLIAHVKSLKPFLEKEAGLLDVLIGFYRKYMPNSQVLSILMQPKQK